MNTEDELFKIEEDGSICFDPTCDNNAPAEIDHSKDHFNCKEIVLNDGSRLVIKKGVNYWG